MSHLRHFGFLVPPVGLHPLDQHPDLFILCLDLLREIPVRTSLLLQHLILGLHVKPVGVLLLADLLDLALHELQDLILVPQLAL